MKKMLFIALFIMLVSAARAQQSHVELDWLAPVTNAGWTIGCNITPCIYQIERALVTTSTCPDPVVNASAYEFIGVTGNNITTYTDSLVLNDQPYCWAVFTIQAGEISETGATVLVHVPVTPIITRGA